MPRATLPIYSLINHHFFNIHTSTPTMPKKKSNKDMSSSSTRKDVNLSRDLLKTMFGECNKNRHLLEQIGSAPGITKSWLTAVSSRPCIYNKQPQQPQVTDITTDSAPSNYSWERYTCHVLPHIQWYLTREENKNILVVTKRVPKIYYYSWRNNIKRPMKHEITRVDRYDSMNRVMKFTNVVECDERFYALSLQGCLVMMEEKTDAVLTITGICRTRAVPSCFINAKYFEDYLIESRGEILLVFLIYRESISRVDEVEVFKLDIDRLELVKVGGLGERALFLEKKYYMWVDAREISCKADCVYFFTNDKWWMYDMGSGSISMEEPGIEQ